ncbi:glycine cleavage complex lipoylprotein [uncultured Eubacteriales bacterium]|uniref:Glycine cleavage system H protein n=1 Tax=uncultured Eubacteriales bacterium TaxID=172733 RepID=A0A212JRS7_9FIRM|nr:glycine cleavage complex lipoylprotein [uncultured Eubacteriales bacterium]
MKFPKGLLYSESHEWVQKLEGGSVRIGLTDFAQHELGDLVFVNLPQVGDALDIGDSFCDVESVKAVSDVYSPLNGTVAAVNDELMDEPQLINESPYDAWLVEVEAIEEYGELMDADAYAAFCEKG